MGDDFLPTNDPTDNLAQHGLPDGDTLQSIDKETEIVVNDCAQVLAEIEDKLQQDIADCVNSCHGDVGLCRSCVLGDIADYINRAGMASNGCGSKIITQVNNAVGQAWASSFDLGIPPPTQLQLQQALNAQTIDFIGNGVAGISDGGGSGISPSPQPQPLPGEVPGPSPGPAQCNQGINPASIQYLVILPGGGYCIPYQWDISAVQNWCVLAFGAGPDAHIALLPTSSSQGIWVSNGCDYAIPQACPQEISPPIQPPPSGGGDGTPPTNGSGGNGTSPPAPGDGTTTLPGGGGGDTLPGGNGGGSGGGTVFPPSGELPCVTFDELSDPAGYAIRGLGYQREHLGNVYWNTFPTLDSQGVIDIHSEFVELGTFQTGKLCAPTDLPVGDTVPGGSGTQQPPPDQPEKLPEALSVEYCDPSKALDILAKVRDFSASRNESWEEIFDRVKTNAEFQQTSNPSLLDLLKDPMDFIAASVVKLAGSAVNFVLTNTSSAQVLGQTCSTNAFGILAARSGLANVFGGWFGLIPQQTTVSNQYTLNLACQYLLPSASEANNYFCRGYVKSEQWSVLVRANGFCEEWQKIDVEARKTRIGIQDAFRLFTLGQLTREQFEESWKRQGIDIDNEEKRWVDAVKQYPGMADLIRMMVRDVEDDKVVDFLKLDGVGDEHFDNKWKGTLKQWGEAQGVPYAVAQYFWRAHWQNPAPGQVYEWLHRLRPDDRDPNDPYASIIFSKDDAKKALAIADYVPGLLENYIATSYRPLTRVDVRRMYEQGVFTSIDQVRRAYRDLGYDATNAENLAKFTVVNSSRSRAKLLGELSVAEVQTAYRNDLVTLSEARDYLARAGLSGDQIPVTLDSIENRKTFDSRKIAIASLQKRYFRGEYTDAQARQALIDAFMDPEDSGRTVKNWSFQRNAREKTPTIAMLCRWYGKGMITLDQMLIRVRNLNYNETDALRIVESCNTDVQQRRQKEIEAALSKLQKEQQAAAREQQKQVRESRQALRELKLTHVHIHTDKRVRKNGKFTTTVTERDVQKPDVNITNISEDVDTNDLPPA
jgi:hypothetical protein